MAAGTHAPVAGSATVLFRKLFDSGEASHDVLSELLIYPVDVEWVEGYLLHRR